jgi:hypothetical protein
MSNVADLCFAAELDRRALASQVQALIAQIHPTVTLERRDDVRIAIPVLFRLTPLDGNRQPIDSQTSIVVGKNISQRGLSFYHEQPMPHRRAFIELAHPGIGSFAAEIDVNWCRFTKPGWYESGARLIAAMVGRGHSSRVEITHPDSLSPFQLLPIRHPANPAAGCPIPICEFQI